MDPKRPQNSYGQSPSNVSVNKRDQSGIAPGYNQTYAQSPYALSGMSLEEEQQLLQQQSAQTPAPAKGGRRRRQSRRSKRSRKSRRTRRR